MDKSRNKGKRCLKTKHNKLQKGIRYDSGAVTFQKEKLRYVPLTQTWVVV